MFDVLGLQRANFTILGRQVGAPKLLGYAVVVQSVLQTAPQMEAMTGTDWHKPFEFTRGQALAVDAGATSILNRHMQSIEASQ